MFWKKLIVPWRNLTQWLINAMRRCRILKSCRSILEAQCPSLLSLRLELIPCFFHIFCELRIHVAPELRPDTQWPLSNLFDQPSPFILLAEEVLGHNEGVLAASSPTTRIHDVDV